ncbi:cytochrome bd-I oxidase subunit CydX [Brevundimonas sp.]|uniref:cytochrome bd-I oxidase subunit CydX n=1 Tax=Brevundimonas sp. TaxID=1871086 RepID=UPI003A9236C5
MWYFAWILGLGLAVAFGILNGLWHEFHLFDEGDEGESRPEPVTPDAPDTPGA